MHGWIAWEEVGEVGGILDRRNRSGVEGVFDASAKREFERQVARY
jgi:hypothetical protein